jgi:hypothetical protein
MSVVLKSTAERQPDLPARQQRFFKVPVRPQHRKAERAGIAAEVVVEGGLQIPLAVPVPPSALPITIRAKSTVMHPPPKMKLKKAATSESATENARELHSVAHQHRRSTRI